MVSLFSERWGRGEVTSTGSLLWGFISGRNFLTLHSESRYFGKCTVCQMKLAFTETVINDYHFRLSVTCRSANNLFSRAFSLEARKKALERDLSANCRSTCFRYITDSPLTVFKVSVNENKIILVHC